MFAFFGKFVGMGYHEESARDARRRITAFLAEHLK
jgi:dienelactone hydrolase